jgi:O-antigen ligase
MEILAGLNALVVAVYLLRTRSELTLPKEFVIAIGVIWSIYLGHLVLSALSGSVLTYSIVRVPVFLTFVILLLFLVPQSTSSETFLYILPRFGAVLTPIGLVVLAVGGFEIGPLELTPYKSTVQIVPLLEHPRVNAMTAVFRNPNTLSFICSLGLVAAVTEFDRRASMPSVILIGLNGIGLRLSGSRAAQLGVLVSLTVYLGYRIVGRRFAVLTLLGAVGALLSLFAVQFDLLPPLPLLADVSLNNRETIWRGVFRAVSSSPYFGRGLVPAGPTIEQFAATSSGTHSGYINQYLLAGLVGLSAYVYLYARTLVSGILSAPTARSMSVYAIAVVPMISQAFDTYSIFGITMLPAVTALSLGFAINEWIETTEPAASESDSPTQFDQPVGRSSD